MNSDNANQKVQFSINEILQSRYDEGIVRNSIRISIPIQQSYLGLLFLDKLVDSTRAGGLLIR